MTNAPPQADLNQFTLRACFVQPVQGGHARSIRAVPVAGCRSVIRSGDLTARDCPAYSECNSRSEGRATKSDRQPCAGWSPTEGIDPVPPERRSFPRTGIGLFGRRPDLPPSSDTGFAHALASARIRARLFPHVVRSCGKGASYGVPLIRGKRLIEYLSRSDILYPCKVTILCTRAHRCRGAAGVLKRILRLRADRHSGVARFSADEADGIGEGYALLAPPLDQASRLVAKPSPPTRSPAGEGARDCQL